MSDTSLSSPVSILPMRHGNGVVDFVGVDLGECFDPTYEAWKQKFEKLSSQLMGKFRSYLWGMETFVSRLHSAPPLYVSILPMRHGNSERMDFSADAESRFDPTYEAWKHAKNERDHDAFTCFDPTYEAWKRINILNINLRKVCFDPTHEAWKPPPFYIQVTSFPAFRSYLWGMETNHHSIIMVSVTSSFDPTYEAWKPKTKRR